MELFLNLFLQCVFWISLGLILHSYGVYPLLIKKLGSVRGTDSTVLMAEDEDQDWPEVNVVMAMYNEESVIKATLQSIVDSDYPRGKLHVFVGSDNSTDNSNKFVEELASEYPFVKLKVFPGRNGKINIVNHLVNRISDEDSVLILCDANVVWAPDLAKNLARHFTDEKVGIVASNVLDRDISCRGIAAEEDAYVNFENRVKHAEGKLWGRMMGAFGACYALRRSVYEPVPGDYNVDDFFETLACYEKGYSGIVDPEAICYESVSEEISEEFRRKKRISKGNFQNLRHFFTYLLPWNCGLPTFFVFWSHKGIRWFGPVLLYCVLVTGISLAWNSHWIYAVAVLGMMISVLMAFADKWMEDYGKGDRLRLLKFVRYFYVMNWALFHGGVEFCKGVSDSVWEPTRRVVAGVNVEGDSPA